MVINRDVEKNGREVNILRVDSLRMLCLERLHKKEADNENKGVYTIDGKQNISRL